MDHDIARILIDRQAIAQRLDELGREIEADFKQRADRVNGVRPRPQITLVPILTGSVIFLADLMRRLPMMMQIELISVSSYPGTSTVARQGHIRHDLSRLPASLAGHHVLVIDDIFDSGQTLRLVTDALRERQPATLKTCVLLRKQRPDVPAFELDYAGFDIPDEFVVGYGLDYNGYYRNLPDIAVLSSTAIARHMQEESQGEHP